MPTLTANPVSGATSPCDGPVNEVGQNSTFSTIVAAAGNQGSLETTSADVCSGLRSSATTNQFEEVRRSGFNFDTSSLTSSATISSATFSLVGVAKTNVIGADSYDCVGFTPVSTASIPASAFGLFGSTSYANVAYAGIDTSGSVYTDWALNASGISNISLAGISSFGIRSGWDRSGTYGGSWVASSNSNFNCLFADNGSNKPKLVVVYSTGITWQQLTAPGQEVPADFFYKPEVASY